MSTVTNTTYPDIQAYAKEMGCDPAVLTEAFAIESHYHDLLINEPSAPQREIIYKEFYHKLLQFYGRTFTQNENIDDKIASKNKQVQLFQKELINKSIIDFGCGEGLFLMNIQKNIPHKKLVGVDIFIPESLQQRQDIQFISSSIIEFKSADKFDVAFSDNVIEHLSPLDLPAHLHAVYQALKPGGKFIIIMPNKLFGPMDITRIIDNSSSGKTAAKGGHLNESTYTEMIHALSKAGFIRFQTVLPIPKLKYSLFKNVRVSTNWIKKIEGSNFLLGLFRMIKINGRCPIRFSVTLICQKPIES